MAIKKLLDKRKKIIHKSKRINDLQEYILVSLSYILLTIILTYPVAFKIKTHIPGMGADSFQWMRILWYTKVAILKPNLTTLTHDYLLFHPDGIESMPFSSAFNQIIYILLSPFFELHIIYTILWLLTFVIGSIGAYILVKYLTGNKYAAFIAGIVFAFSPYHYSRGLYFFGAATIQWIPFCALFLMKMIKEERIKNAIFAGIFFVLVAMSDLQYLVFMGIFVGLVFIYDFYRKLVSDKDFIKAMRPIIKKYTMFGIVAFSGVLPLTINEILVALSDQNFLKPNYVEILELSNDFISFFVPSHLHPLFGELTVGFYSNIPSWLPEKVNFIGYVVLGLTTFVFLKLRKNPDVKFWLISTFFFTIISLGPILHVNGESSFTFLDINIPLPHTILYHIVPFLDNCRTVGRFFVIATLGYSVLVGYGLSALIRNNIEKKSFIFGLAGILIILEYLCVPYPTTAASIPAFYYNLHDDTDNYAILEIPGNSNAGYMNFEYLYYQTAHEKPLVGGYAARYPAEVNDFKKYTPIVRELTYYRLPSDDILQENITQIGTSVLNAYSIRYVILHKNQLTKEQIDFANDLLKKTLKTEPETYNEGRLIVYPVQNETVLPYMILKGGWHWQENRGGTPTRWISNNATLIIYSNITEKATLKFRAHSFYHPRTLEIYNGNSLQNKKTIGTDFITVYTPITLQKGENVIRLYVPEGSEKPCEIPELKSKDTRELSIAIQEVRLIQTYNTEYSEISIPSTTVPKSVITVNATIKNAGTSIWNKEGEQPVHISYHWAKENKTVIWDGIRTPLPYDVEPGKTITNEILVKTPDEEGNYTLVIDLVKEGVCWFESQGAKPFEKEIEISKAFLGWTEEFEYQTDYIEINRLHA